MVEQLMQIRIPASLIESMSPREQEMLQTHLRQVIANVPAIAMQAIMVRTYYESLMDQGFSEHDALELCRNYHPPMTR